MRIMEYGRKIAARNGKRGQLPAPMPRITISAAKIVSRRVSTENVHKSLLCLSYLHGISVNDRESPYGGSYIC